MAGGERPGIEIREAQSPDAVAIAALLDQLGYPSSPQLVAARLAGLEHDPGSWVWVAGEGGRIVGLAGLHVLPLIEREPLGRLTAIVVTDEARGRGIGRALVEGVEARARAEGCERLEVTSAERRSDAHAFYRELGFEEASRRFLKRL